MPFNEFIKFQSSMFEGSKERSIVTSLRRKPLMNSRALRHSLERGVLLRSLRNNQKAFANSVQKESVNIDLKEEIEIKPVVIQELPNINQSKIESKPMDYQDYLKSIKKDMRNIVLWRGTIGDKLNLSINIAETERRKFHNK